MAHLPCLVPQGINSSPLVFPEPDTAGRVNFLYRWQPSASAWTYRTDFDYDAVSHLSAQTINVAGTSYDVTSSFAYNPASQIASRSQTNDTYASTLMSSQNITRDYTPNGLNQYTITRLPWIGTVHAIITILVVRSVR